MIKYLFLLIGLLALAVALLWGAWRGQRQEARRLSHNQRALLEDVRLYRTRDSLSAASVGRLTLTKKEMESYQADLHGTIEALNVKLRRLESVTDMGTRTRYEVRTVVRDSLVYRDRTGPDTLPCLHFRNPYLELDGCIDSGRFSGRIVSYDTLVTVVHRIPRRFLFFRWGTKAVRLEAVSKNPHTSLEYARYIELKKKRKKR